MKCIEIQRFQNERTTLHETDLLPSMDLKRFACLSAKFRFFYSNFCHFVCHLFQMVAYQTLLEILSTVKRSPFSTALIDIIWHSRNSICLWICRSVGTSHLESVRFIDLVDQSLTGVFTDHSIYFKDCELESDFSLKVLRVSSIFF